MITILSLGAGVQSSTLALMAAHGEVTPMPDCAIFADTGAEPKAVYEWLDWLEGQLPYPVYRVAYRNLRGDINRVRPTGKYNIMPIPLWVRLSENGNWRNGGLLARQCTTDYKIKPIQKKIRQLLGIYKKRTPKELLVTQWIGISSDERQRIKISREPYIKNRWPLIEKNINRTQCLEWMQRNNYKFPPRSACTFCPFHDNDEWRHIKETEPESFEDACKIDDEIRELWQGPRGQNKTAQFFLHKEGIPLRDVDLSVQVDDQFDLFGFANECDGMCGV